MKKKLVKLESVYAVYEGRKLILNAFRSGISPVKQTKGKGLKTPK